MLFFKKLIVTTILFSAALFIPTFAMACDANITISGLGDFNLAAFDLNVNYNDSLLIFGSYALTEELGSFTDPPNSPDAEDWSLGDDGSGTVNLAVFSYLLDFSSQPDAFTLATLSFSGDENAMAAISLSDIVLSDTFGDPLPFAVTGSDISVVPIPGAIWLLCTGLGAVGIRKKIIKK